MQRSLKACDRMPITLNKGTQTIRFSASMPSPGAGGSHCGLPATQHAPYHMFSCWLQSRGRAASRWSSVGREFLLECWVSRQRRGYQSAHDQNKVGRLKSVSRQSLCNERQHANLSWTCVQWRSFERAICHMKIVTKTNKTNLKKIFCKITKRINVEGIKEFLNTWECKQINKFKTMLLINIMQIHRYSPAHIKKTCVILKK